MVVTDNELKQLMNDPEAAEYYLGLAEQVDTLTAWERAKRAFLDRGDDRTAAYCQERINAIKTKAE